MRLAPITLAAAAVMLSGCLHIFEEKIPEFATSTEQYRYANDLVALATPLPEDHSQDSWRQTNLETPYYQAPLLRYRDRDYRRFIRAFERVVARFPDDDQFTPEAKVRLGEFHFQLQEYGLAASYYTDVLNNYPEEALLQAAALWGLGNVRLAQGQYAEAQRQYMQLVREHGASENIRIAELAQRATLRIQQIQYSYSR